MLGEISQIRSYQKRFGDDWRTQYETNIGPVTTAYKRIALSSVGMLSVGGLLWWVYRDFRKKPQMCRHHKSVSDRNPVERKVRYRRRAILGNYFGLAGILAGLGLVLIDLGMFEDLGNQVSLGVFVFLGGYLGVTYGCWWWLKAKGLNPSLISIGLLPVIVLCIPYVQAVFGLVPGLLELLMVAMPILLLVVVMALPDRTKGMRK